MTGFLSRKVELRFVLLLLTASLIGAVLFGWAVKAAMERREAGQGAPDGGVLRVAGFPTKVGEVFHSWFSPSRWESTPPPPPPEGAAPAERERGPSVPDFRDPGYLLLSRIDADLKTGLVELVRLHPWEVLHTWRPDEAELTAITGGPYQRLYPPKPYVLHDGSILLSSRVPSLGARTFFRLDACSAVRWAQHGGRLDRKFHHSIERDAEGYFWLPYVPEGLKNAIPGSPSTWEHGLARISASGEVLSLVSLSGALIRAGYSHVLYGMDGGYKDLMHMNDIQPVLEDGPHWRRGDLFVSLRTPSLVLLYRPSSDEVVWAQAGPWLHQHDVNVLGPHEISIFSNNSFLPWDEEQERPFFSEVMVYDFRTGETRSPWRDALARHGVYTVAGGRATVLGNGDVFVEATSAGRALRVAADGTLRWEYVNESGKGKRYRLGWSRYLDAREGAAVAEAVAAADCA